MPSGQTGLPDGVLVVGRDDQQIVFLDTGRGSVLQVATLLYGMLTSPPRLWGPFALLGEGGASFGASALHAFDLSATTISDLWNPGIQVKGSVDATPLVLGDTLWAASNIGYLFPVTMSNIRKPQPGQPFDALGLSPGATSKITSLLATSDGNHLLLVTQTGVYGVDLTGPKPVRSWTALASLDLTGVPAVLDGDLLLVAAGTMVYALPAYPTSSSPQPVWTYPADLPIKAMLAMGGRFVLLIGEDADGSEGGSAYLIDNSNATSLARFSLSLQPGAAAWTNRCGDLLASLSPGGQLAADSLPVSVTGTITPDRLWTYEPDVRFAGPPATTDGLAFAAATDGSLWVFDLAAKAVVYSMAAVPGPVGSAVVFFAPAVRGASTASVRFLLDGEAFLPTMRDLLIATLQRSFAPPTSMPADLTFESLIKAVGASGADAYVLMWDTSIVYAMTEDRKGWTKKQLLSTLGVNAFAYYFTSGGAVKGDHRLNAQTWLALQGAAGVHAYLEPYNTWLDIWYSEAVEIGSNHQKIAIFSVNGTKVALVSGLNVASYYDTTAHPFVDFKDPARPYKAWSWHDTGLVLQGDAVALVEAEFDRRWSKQGAAPAPGSDTYVKVAAWQIARDTCLDAPSVCGRQTTQPTPYQDRRVTTSAVDVRVAITCNENFLLSQAKPTTLYTWVHQIQDQLISAIGGASSYVYLENYGLQDPGIVAALARRIQAAPAGFVVIVVIPHPTVNDALGKFSESVGNIELARYSYAALTLVSRDWATATVRKGATYTAADGASVLFDRRGVDYAQVTFGGASPVTVNIRDITAFTLTGQPRSVLFCSPARYFQPPPPDTTNALAGQPANFRGVYVHSKLALIDDTQAVVGSANFTLRSMEQDGEMSVFVNDPATAAGIRQELFGHWGMTSVANWEATMTRFAATSTPSLGILPLPYSSMPQYSANWPWYLITLMFDPSPVN